MMAASSGEGFSGFCRAFGLAGAAPGLLAAADIFSLPATRASSSERRKIAGLVSLVTGRLAARSVDYGDALPRPGYVPMKRAMFFIADLLALVAPGVAVVEVGYVTDLVISLPAGVQSAEEKRRQGAQIAASA
jgi:hypothetical protein